MAEMVVMGLLFWWVFRLGSKTGYKSATEDMRTTRIDMALDTLDEAARGEAGVEDIEAARARLREVT